MTKRLLENKVAIVTGAGQGIGLAIAKKLSGEGAIVVLNDKEQKLAEEARDSIRGMGGTCTAIGGDVAQASFVRFLVDEAIRLYQSVDIAVANAGITLFGDFFDYNEEDFYTVLRTNLGGTFFLAQAAAQQMKIQGTGGKLLFMSSVTGHQAHKNLAAYSMTKAGVEMLARNLVIELSQYRININAIAPGATLTERTMSDPDYKNTWAKITPIGRAGTVEDVANAACFLVSSMADQITGQTIVIDGGWSSISPSPY